MGLIFFIILIIFISNYNKGLKNNQNANKNQYSSQRRYSNGQQVMNRQANPYQTQRQNPYTSSVNININTPYGQKNISNAFQQLNFGFNTNYGTPANPAQSRQNQSVNSYGLPSSSRARTKIVKKFNQQYELNLTDNDIKAIVDASYMSSYWAKEICYMNQRYENVYSWFSTGNTWLKTYLYVFPMQQITSDFTMQESIVYNTLNQVFSDILSRPNITVAEAIYEINNKYYTRFDDNTFMIAYRFMEQKGKRFPLNFTNVVSGTSDIDNLLSKYNQQQTPMN